MIFYNIYETLVFCVQRLKHLDLLVANVKRAISFKDHNTVKYKNTILTYVEHIY